ncbi:FAD/NAD(P)-binding domain-containing protein [Auricularia subglabra TFB-10046 SS5]|nr:FAD/NAD(P)-binding domain-containing protein [Auricularia subglabra TFB-10046 SS5]
MSALTPFSGRGAAFHRADLRAAFARNIGRFASVRVHFNKRLTSLRVGVPAPPSVTGTYELRFAGGTKAACDVLVGADGVRSPVRRAMLHLESESGADVREYAPPVWSGECVYRALVPMPVLAAEWARLGGVGEHRIMQDRLLYCGKRKKIVTYAIQNKAIANVAVFLAREGAEGQPFDSEHWVEDVDPSFLPKEFVDWETGALALINCIKQASRWAIHAVKPLPFFAHERVAVIGDAAHAMTPHNGSGANQAFEDAFVLGRLLTHPATNAMTAHLALQAYDAVRRPRAQAVAELSRELGRLGDFTAGLGDDEKATAARMASAGAWIWQGSIEEDVQKAVAHFESLIGPTTRSA